METINGSQITEIALALER